MTGLQFTQDIYKITAEFISKFGHLSVEQLNLKPAADVWSIAQNISHLIVINRTYFPIFEELQKGTYKVPFTRRIGFLVNFFGNSILKTVQPDRRKKMRTFPMWEPDKSTISGDIFSKFEEHQKMLAYFVENADKFIKQGAVISSPANKVIVYKLETAFEIIITHEKRHLAQACEVYDILKFNDN